MSQLLEKTRELMAGMAMTHVAAARRWQVDRVWIRLVIDGKIKNPGVVTIERIYNDLRASRRARPKRARRQ
jgi:hypothetical protein